MSIERTFLLPGDFAVAQRPSHLGTLLGSCVSVCLSNPYRNVAAMNHFMLPNASGSREVGRFGDTSTHAIINALFAVDADPRHYRARLYGGAAVIGHLGAMGNIGERNVEVARETLQQRGIAIVGEEVGGSRGRRIDFYTDTNVIESRLLGSSRNAPTARRPNHIRLLLVDDSKLVRKVLRKTMEGVDSIEVVGEASNPFEAREMILQHDPDVITLDVEMPRMDGLTFLSHLMSKLPKPVIIVSSMKDKNTNIHLRAKQAGAFGVLHKDDLQLFRGMDAIRDILVPLIQRAARTQPKQL
ncbi:MAG: response regulator [Polyangiales bacterium]